MLLENVAGVMNWFVEIVSIIRIKQNTNELFDTTKTVEQTFT